MIFKDFYKGIGKSEYDQGGFHSIVNCDIHTTPGKVKSSLLMAKESSSTVTEPIRSVVILSDATSFWFSQTSGKIWKRTSTGVWSLAHTNTVGACGGAAYYNQYIYYASGNKLGRIAATNASSEAPWSSETDGWATFSTTNTSHPMIEVNLTLFIGAGRYIASVNSADTFTAEALDIPYGPVTTALATWETDLIIGTKTGSANGQAGTFRWDTYSDSWTIDDDLPENGVHMFIKSDNRLFAQIGESGSLYEYNGSKMIKVLDIRDEDGILTEENLAMPSGSTVFNGIPMFATLRGVFSYNRSSSSFPDALAVEYVTSGGRDSIVRCVASVGGNLLASWRNGASYGVDVVSTNRANGIIITPLVDGEFSNVVVKYSSLPTGTSISIRTKVDGGSWTAQTVTTDTINKICYFDGGLGTTSTLQAEVTLNSSGTDTPEIESIELK